DVLAGPQRGDRLRGVVGDRRVDVDGVDVGVFEEVVDAGVAAPYAELVAAPVELGLVTAADGDHLGVGVRLVGGDELGPEVESDDGDANLVFCHDFRSLTWCLNVWRRE